MLRHWRIAAIIGGAAIAALVVVIAGRYAIDLVAESRRLPLCVLAQVPPDERISACTAFIESDKPFPGPLNLVLPRDGSRQQVENLFRAMAFFGRGRAYVEKGDLSLAIADYDKSIELAPKNTDMIWARGRAYFYATDYGAAAADMARTIQYGSDRGYIMLWLYLARARAGEQGATAELAAGAGKLNPTSWPYPIIELYVGRRSPEGTLAAASSDHGCQAHFYIGEWHLLRDNRGTANQLLKAAADICPWTSFAESEGAKAELKQLGE